MTIFRRYVVTGGTGALGRELVALLMRDGGRVAVPYRRDEAFRELSASLAGEEGLFGAKADVADVASVADFFDHAVEALKGLDGVAALAGTYAGSTTLESAPPSEWSAMLNLNLSSTYATARAALPYLLRSGGSFVTVSSKLVASGGSGAAAYTVAKAGVEALTRALASENRDRGVRFNCIEPGIIDTPANRRAMPHADRSAWTPPGAIARVVAFLLSSESAPVTGAVIPVDGREQG